MELQIGNISEKKYIDEISSMLFPTQKESFKRAQYKKFIPIRFDLSEKSCYKILSEYTSLYRKEILEEISIGDLSKPNDLLIHEVKHELKEISEFEEVNLFSSEWQAFTQLGEYYRQISPKSRIIVLGFPEFPLPSNYLFVKQLYELKELLKEPHRIAAILVDPLFFIIRSNAYVRKINTLRKQCSGRGIPFILDERKTAARIHLKGLNFVFQFKADAILIGGNYTNGIPFAALACTRSYSGNSALSGANAPSSLALKAFLKISRHLKMQGNSYYTYMNHKAHKFCQLVNHYNDNRKVGIRLNNFGSILWLGKNTLRNLPKKFKDKGILSPNSPILYLPSSLNKKDLSDLAHLFSLALKKPSRRKAGRLNNKTTI